MIKNIIRDFVVKTNYPPFIYLYKLCYDAALKIITHVLKNQKDIMTIYLVAGMTTGDCIYGLSDIDIIIIVKNSEAGKRRIENLYKKLCRLIPFIKYDERGIYTAEEIERYYRETNLCLKYKIFNECKKKGKLLYGTDILRNFNELDDIERNEFILGQLTFIWSIFQKDLFVEKKVRDTVMLNYICYKVTSDVCKTLISAHDNQDLFNRMGALERAARLLDGTYKTHIERVKLLAKSGFTADASSLIQNTYYFYINAMCKTVDLLPRIQKSAAERKAPCEAHFDFEHVDFILSDLSKHKINTLVELVKTEYAEYVRSILITPFDISHNNPLNEEYISLFIIPKRPIPFEAIMKLGSIIKTKSGSQRLYLYMIVSEMLLSLNGFDPAHPYSGIFLLQWMDVTVLSYLRSPYSTLLGEPLEYNGEDIVKNYSPYNIFEWFSQEEAVIHKFIHEANIIRLGTIEFQVFFWQALRLKLIGLAADSAEKNIPLSSKQICQLAEKIPGFNFPWLKQFHDEYQKDLNGQLSKSEAYFQFADTALKQLYHT